MPSHGLVWERVLPLSILVLAVVAVPTMTLAPGGLDRLSSLQEESVRAEAQVSRLSQEIQHLRAEVSRIKQEPAAVERAARDELGLVRQTELVFHFAD
jgi:cell division protein FtsB